MVIRNNHSVTVTTCQKTTHSTTTAMPVNQVVRLPPQTHSVKSWQLRLPLEHQSTKYARHSVASVVITTVYQVLCSPQLIKCCTHPSLPSVVLATVYQVLYLPQSTKFCICHTLPSVVFATLYQALYLPQSTKCYTRQFTKRWTHQSTKSCICHNQVLCLPVYQVLYLPQFTKRWTHQSTKSCICQSTNCCTCHSLPSVACYKHLIQRSTMPVTHTLVHHSANHLSCYGHYIQPDVPATRRDASFNPMCLPQEKNPPHSNKQFSC